MSKQDFRVCILLYLYMYSKNTTCLHDSIKRQVSDFKRPSFSFVKTETELGINTKHFDTRHCDLLWTHLALHDDIILDISFGKVHLIVSFYRDQEKLHNIACMEITYCHIMPYLVAL